jgi:cell division transport system permease protein
MAIQEGKSTYKRRPSYLPSIISISLVLFMVGVFGIIIISGKKLSDHIKEHIQLNVFLKDEASESDMLGLQKKLEMEDFTKEVRFISKKDAANEFQQELGHDFVEFIGYNPLLSSIELSLKAEFADVSKMKEVEKKLLSNPIVEEVTYQQNLIEQVNANLKTIGWIVLAVSGLFFMIALTLINSTIRLNLYARRFLIKSMQLVGATQWFIIRPFMLRSVLHGIYSAFIAGALLAGVLSFLPQKLAGVQQLYDYNQFAVLFAGILLAGMIISMVSSWIATKRYLRLKLDDLY